MLIPINPFRRWRVSGSMIAAIALPMMIAACGDENDPDAVSAADLKPPGQLMIKDNGSGSVTLTWNTTNPEEDFEGYNIYGAKLASLPSGITEGVPIELLDGAGDPIETAKTAMGSFSYDTSNSNVLDDGNAGAPVVLDEEEAKFAALPLHTRGADGAPLFPSCRPNAAAATCDAVTAADEVDASTITSFGPISYTVTGLTVGAQYCFTVFTVQDGGAEVSQSSSNVSCIVPKFLIKDNQATVAAAGRVGYYIKLRELTTNCAAGSCAALNLTTSDSSTSILSNVTDTALSIEAYPGDGSNVFIATGSNAAIRPMGYFANGFMDPLPEIPAFKYESAGSKAAPAHGGGYSRESQSVLLQPGFMYVIATGKADKTSSPDLTNYAYHWLWVNANNTSITRGVAFSFDLMLANHNGP